MLERVSLRRYLDESACFVLLIIQFHRLGELWKRWVYAGSCYRRARASSYVRWRRPFCWLHPKATWGMMRQEPWSLILFLESTGNQYWVPPLWLCLSPITAAAPTSELLPRWSFCFLRVSQWRLSFMSRRGERPTKTTPDHSHVDGPFPYTSPTFSHLTHQHPSPTQRFPWGGLFQSFPLIAWRSPDQQITL